MTDIVKYIVLAASKGLARVLLRLDLGHAGDGRELGDELLLRRVVGGLPRVVVRARLIDHDFLRAADESRRKRRRRGRDGGARDDTNASIDEQDAGAARSRGNLRT